mgnify:CR=1 FL=1
MKKKILTLITICLILVCFSINVFSANEVSQNEIIEREELHNRGKLHNEVTIYIVNDKGEVLLQRRSKNRRFCPNKLGVIAGHQSYREDILTCAVRETKEEVGLKIKKDDLHPLCDKYLVEEKYNNHYMYPYYVICNQKAEDFTIQN